MGSAFMVGRTVSTFDERRWRFDVAGVVQHSRDL
jgi:hypothetical protein